MFYSAHGDQDDQSDHDDGGHDQNDGNRKAAGRGWDGEPSKPSLPPEDANN